MSVQVFEKSVLLPRPASEAFAWLERPGALERLTPPWETVKVLKAAESLQDGTVVELEAKAGPARMRWVVEHRNYKAGAQFEDFARESPFAAWSHLHRVDAVGTGEARLTDHIRYALPLAPLSNWIAGGWVRAKLERMFEYRHRIMQDDLEVSRRYGAVRRLRILLAGGSGLVGSALVPFLRTQGHEVLRLVRRPARGNDELQWNPGVEALDPHVLKGVDVVINLAGESLVSGRWTESRKRSMQESRLQTTRTLVQAIEKAKHRPFVFINASAIGYYDSCGEQRLDEHAKVGRGYLADLCAAWEKEALVAEEWGVRVAALRIGIVVSAEGGALAKMLPAYRFGLGGPLGNRNHWMSWISRDDLLGMIYHCIMDQRCRGPINAVAPQPVRQAEWARTLGGVLRRPAFFPVPGFVLRAVFGEMADEALLSSARVVPAAMQAAGYVFRHPTLHSALSHTLGRPQPARREEQATSRRGGRSRRR